MQRDIFDVGFWPQVDGTQLMWFFVLLLVGIGGLLLAKWWHDRRQEQKEALEFADYTRKAGFTAQEYEVAVDLVNKYRITPPIRLLRSLRQFDVVATEEIGRALADASLETGQAKTRVQLFYASRVKLAALEREQEESSRPKTAG